MFDLSQSRETKQPEVAAVIKNVKGDWADERRVAIAEIAEYDGRKKSGCAPERRVRKKMESGKCGTRHDVCKGKTSPARAASGIAEQKRLEATAKNDLFEYGIDERCGGEAQRLTRDPQQIERGRIPPPQTGPKNRGGREGRPQMCVTPNDYVRLRRHNTIVARTSKLGNEGSNFPSVPIVHPPPPPPPPLPPELPARTNAAPTALAEFIVIAHGLPCPAQAPDQLEKTEFADGVAVSVTITFGS